MDSYGMLYHTIPYYIVPSTLKPPGPVPGANWRPPIHYAPHVQEPRGRGGKTEEDSRPMRRSSETDIRSP